MKKPAKRLSEEEVITLADELALEFWLPGSEAKRKQHSHEARAHWETIKDQRRIVWLTYLLRFLVTCPPLFDRPTGFDWILTQVQWELYYRKANRSADRDFWAAVKEVQKAMRSGRLSDKAKDYFRYERVKALMKEHGIKKTQAVEHLAEREEGSRDIRGIWKALARVEREQSARLKLLRPP